MAKLHFITFLKTCTYNDGKKQLSTITCRMFVNYYGSSLAKAVRDGLNNQAYNLPHHESQQNLLLIDYQRIKYNTECNC